MDMKQFTEKMGIKTEWNENVLLWNDVPVAEIVLQDTDMGPRFFYRSSPFKITPEIIWEEMDLDTAKNCVLRKIYEAIEDEKKKLLFQLIKYSDWALPHVSDFVNEALLTWLPYLESKTMFFKESIKFIQQFCNKQEVNIPVAVGDMLYRTNKGAAEPVIEMKVISILQAEKGIRIGTKDIVDGNEHFYDGSDVGKTVFLSADAAYMFMGNYINDDSELQEYGQDKDKNERKAIISRNTEPELKEQNTVYLQIKEGVTKEDLITIARRMMADLIICQEEKYYVYGINSMGSTWYLDKNDSSGCTLWDGAPKEMRAVYDSKEEALEKVKELDEAYKFNTTRHTIQQFLVEEKYKVVERNGVREVVKENMEQSTESKQAPTPIKKGGR